MPNDTPEVGQERKHEHVIFIDGKQFKVDTDFMNGAQIKALGGVPSDYQLFLEQKGEDKPIPDAESIKIENGMHFFAVPPATFGL